MLDGARQARQLDTRGYSESVRYRGIFGRLYWRNGRGCVHVGAEETHYCHLLARCGQAVPSAISFLMAMLVHEDAPTNSGVFPKHTFYRCSYPLFMSLVSSLFHCSTDMLFHTGYCKSRAMENEISGRFCANSAVERANGLKVF